MFSTLVRMSSINSMGCKWLKLETTGHLYKWQLVNSISSISPRPTLSHFNLRLGQLPNKQVRSAAVAFEILKKMEKATTFTGRFAYWPVFRRRDSMVRGWTRNSWKAKGKWLFFVDSEDVFKVWKCLDRLSLPSDFGIYGSCPFFLSSKKDR